MDVEETFQEYLAQMVAGDTAALGTLLTDDFVLIHMTGFRQPKNDWLAGMRAGQFVYDGSEVRTLYITEKGSTAHLISNVAVPTGDAVPGGFWRLRHDCQLVKKRRYLAACRYPNIPLLIRGASTGRPRM